MEELTDREKLALAFNELNERGYYAPINFAWEICCMSCGVAAVDKAYQEGKCKDPDKYVFWHVQKDDRAFYGEPEGEIPEAAWEKAMESAPETDDEEELTAYLDEFFDAFMGTDEYFAMELEERLNKYNMLQEELYLHWDGDAFDIVEVLRKYGLKAELPDALDGRCILVNA